MTPPLTSIRSMDTVSGKNIEVPAVSQRLIVILNQFRVSPQSEATRRLIRQGRLKTKKESK